MLKELLGPCNTVEMGEPSAVPRLGLRSRAGREAASEDRGFSGSDPCWPGIASVAG